jgi:hypothetical protein
MLSLGRGWKEQNKNHRLTSKWAESQWPRGQVPNMREKLALGHFLARVEVRIVLVSPEMGPICRKCVAHQHHGEQEESQHW